MKIEDVIKWHRDHADAYRPLSRQLSDPHDEAAEGIEQHLKDLMGLVEAWRTRAELNTPKWGSHDEYSLGISRASDWCADELESLINPKD